MEDFNKTFIKFIFIAFFIFAVIATSGCTKKVYNSGSSTPAAPSSCGGQDCGGGDTQGSRKASVEANLRDIEDVKLQVGTFITHIYMMFVSPGDDAVDGYSRADIDLFLSFYYKLIERKIFEEVEDQDVIQFKFDEVIKSGGKAYIYEKLPYGEATSASARGASPQALQMLLSYIGFYDFSLKLEKMREDLLEGQGVRFTKNFKNYTLGNVQISLKKDEACKDLHENPKTGAVQSFDGDILDICLSMKQFESVAEDSLKQQIYALVVHELSHLAGFYEEDAQKIQRMVLDAYTKTFSVQPNSFTVLAIYTDTIKLNNVIELLETLLDEKTMAEFETCKLQEKTKKSIQSIANIISMDDAARQIFVSNYQSYIYIRNLIYTKQEQKIFQSLNQLKMISHEANSVAKALTETFYQDDVCKFIEKDDYRFIQSRLIVMKNRLEFIRNTFSKMGQAL